MTALANFRHLARGGQPHQEEHPQLPDTNQPGVSITALFPFQSYFDSVLLQQALLQQSKNEPIVNSLTPAIGAVTKMVKTQIGGYSIGLHPSSQTPVAVQPLAAGQPTSPQPVILKPGQIYRPHGRPYAKAGNFSAVNWGIPFGWLGGGVATLYIFASPDADVAWPGNMELIFHRQRMQIVSSAGLPANAPKNWPLRFPWTQANRAGIDQSGQAIIGVEPTQVLMSLRLGSLAAPAPMRILIQESNDFDLDASSALVPTPVRFVDYFWGSYAATGGAGNLSTAFPVVTAPTEWKSLSADDGGVQLVDLTGGFAPPLAGQFVDVVRYGRL